MTSERRYRQDPFISCFVPNCKNTAFKCKDKYFFHIPFINKAEWCAAVSKPNVPKGGSYICEDHINLEEDLQNYDAWKLGNVRARLKVRVPADLKNIPTNKYNLPSTSSIALPSSSSMMVENKSTMCEPEKYDKSIQVKPIMVNTAVSARVNRTCKKNTTVEELSELETPSFDGSTVEFTETESSSVAHVNKQVLGRIFLLNLIEKKPLGYIGISNKFYWIIEYLEKHCKIPSLHIIITLYKIKNNDTFSRISDIFEISLSTLWRLFYKTLAILKAFFNQLLYSPAAIDVKRNLPLVFKANQDYANIQYIIDCFEIEIEKPKNPVHQSLTWSQYKNCNTIKYLIGATPDGFINFISEGYGGRISDMYLVEQSGFIETVPENCTILADRGFKHLEALLAKKSIKVLRPPSVSKDSKMSKSEVIQSKVVASLRVHIERVIRRVRLYRMLKPHSVVNNKLVSALDDVVIVVCGLINLQPPVIKYD